MRYPTMKTKHTVFYPAKARGYFYLQNNHIKILCLAQNSS